MSKNVVDNLPVFVEFNQTYKLLLVSCLLYQKKFFFEVRNIPWLDKANWEKRDQTGFLDLNIKKRWRSENAKPFVCVKLKYF